MPNRLCQILSAVDCRGKRAAGVLAVACALSLPAAPVRADAHAAAAEARMPAPAYPFLPLPGAPPPDAELRRRLAAAWREQHARGYRPRAAHRLADGTPRYANRLLSATSPYLLQHAHNPVDWRPWNGESLEAARRQNRLILLSIGYSTCHWCHVMERESFEDEEIAATLNRRYLAIKVDREERPDLDAIFMTAVQLLNGRGGWPMTLWLTPDGRPVYGATYLPPRDGDRGVRHGFLTLLQALADKYAGDPDEVASYGLELTAAVREALHTPATDGGAVPGPEAIAAARGFYLNRGDEFYGGLNRAPKFPSGVSARLLLRAQGDGQAAARAFALLGLRRMAAGGLFDQLGGGFHRYATDMEWRVPHFEKMLYDNALLVRDYLEAYQLTGDEAFADVARATLDYLRREMTSPDGAFHSASDADSRTPDGDFAEGWFFTWTPAEIRAVLPPDQAEAAIVYYDVVEHGSAELRGRSVLHRARDDADAAAALGIAPEELRRRLRPARAALLDARRRRPPPALDDKVLTAWNGLAIAAFARAALVLNEPGYLDAAAAAADFVLDRLRDGPRLRRSYRAGVSSHNGYLDDYAFLIAGLLDLYQSDARARWIDAALALQRTLDRHFWDADGGGYFFTSDDHETLLARSKPAADGAEPSGNSVALMNLLRLAGLTGDMRYRQRAGSLLAAFATPIGTAPQQFAEMLIGLDFYHAGAREIVIVTPAASPDSAPASDPAAAARAAAEPFLALLRGTWLPHAVLVVGGETALRAQQHQVPLLQGKRALAGRATAYVCENGACQLPTQDPQAFARQLAVAVNGDGNSDRDAN